MGPGSFTPPSPSLLELLASLRRPKANLPGVRLIEPLHQGDYDGLCGLYCIINAVRLVLAPHHDLTDEEVRSLFWTGVRYLDSEGSLSKALRLSVGRRLWPKLAERIRSRAEQITNIRIVFDRPKEALATPEEALAAIETMIVAKQAPMVFMRGKYRHYSVVCGYTLKSLRLFDSYGYQWVRRASCGPADCTTSLHRFHLASMIAVRASPKIAREEKTCLTGRRRERG